MSLLSWLTPKSLSEKSVGSCSYFLHYEFRNGKIYISWIDGKARYKLAFGPNGFNSLPNIIGIFIQPVFDSNNADWEALNVGPTDWLPPLRLRQKNTAHPDKPFFTGGNHGSNGDASGDRTAKCTIFHILIDGIPIQEGDKGYCSSITFFIANELMAMNTVRQKEYVAEQSFVCSFTAGCMSLSHVMRNLSNKDLVVDRDYGPQMVAKGFDERLLILDGKNTHFQSFSGELNSGIKEVHPRAWAAIAQSRNGQQVSWIDRDYGIADGSCVSPDTFLIKGSGKSTGKKIYHAAICGDDAFTLLPGQSYKWRGGYSWQFKTGKSVNHIATFRFLKQQSINFTAVKSACFYTNFIER